jgi:hypothetical protein
MIRKTIFFILKETVNILFNDSNSGYFWFIFLLHLFDIKHNAVLIQQDSLDFRGKMLKMQSRILIKE